MLYRKLKKILDFVLFILFLLTFFSVLPYNLPIKSYVVVTGSMEPIINAGSFVFAQSLTKSKIKAGDIVTFRSPRNSQTIIVHRINKIDNNIIYTKGDNNNSVDDWQISSSNILGKPFLIIPYIGSFFNLIHTPIGFVLIICLPALVFVVLQTLTIRSALLEIENKKKY